nr:hypothetical protein [Tanacetum cinerariifolium]
MLAPGRYPQWRSRFLRYVDTRPNGEALRKCILSGPYKPTTVLVHVVEATDDSPVIPEHTTVETPMNMSPENKAHFLAENKAIHLILTEIGDDIYSIVDACQMAQEMWEAIERLQQGESLNIQDVKTNLFWEFEKFTSHDGESMESYYTRFYKLMNEMIRNNLTVTTMQVNVQFLQQLQPKWSRFVTIVKQQHELDEASYHKLFDILKQYQNEVNKLRAEKIDRIANPLALVATAQASQDQYYQTSRSHRSFAPSPKPLIPSRSQTTTRHKGKEIAKPITPSSENLLKRTVILNKLRGTRIFKRIWLLFLKVDEQELEAHYSYMAKIQEVPTADSCTDLEPVEQIIQLILFIVDSGCTKHMTGNLKLLCNFAEKFLGTVHFGNDQFAPILGYGDLVQGNVTINRVYYVEGLNHHLFSVGQFFDADLEVAFRKSTCFVRDLQGNDLLTGIRGSDLNTISLQESTSSTPLCLMAKASPTQACSFKSKVVPSSKGRLNLLYMDLCGPMRVASINGKKYILVIVDDYSRYTWTLFLRSKDDTPEVLKDFLTMIQRNLQALVITVRTDRGIEFLNKTLNAFFKKEGIEHQTSTARTPEQNGVVERRNRTLVEDARTMLSASQLLLFFRLKQLQPHATLRIDP